MEWKRRNKKKKKRLEKYEELRRRGGTKTSLRKKWGDGGKIKRLKSREDVETEGEK